MIKIVLTWLEYFEWSFKTSFFLTKYPKYSLKKQQNKNKNILLPDVELAFYCKLTNTHKRSPVLSVEC